MSARLRPTNHTENLHKEIYIPLYKYVMARLETTKVTALAKELDVGPNTITRIKLHGGIGISLESVLAMVYHIGCVEIKTTVGDKTHQTKLTK